jgi:hypothetical protein
MFSVLQLEFANFSVVFRTSEKVVAGGFEMYVVCFRPDETSLPGCIETSEFTTGVCATPNTTETKRSANYRGYTMFRSQRSTLTRPQIASFYSDLFPNSGFPPDLPISQDLAMFHHWWYRQRNVPGLTLIEVDVLYNQTVNYTRNTILIMDLNGHILARYVSVRVLRTFDSDGVVQTHISEVRDERNPHYHGAGFLRIVRRRAYFQLFRIDPRGIRPNEEEQKVLITMKEPLLNSNFFRVNNNSNNIRLRPPRNMNGPQFNEKDRDAVLAALKGENSCNAVLRAQSRATLTYYNDTDPGLVEYSRTFNISCSLTGNMLSCTSDDITLPGRTMCQIDELQPVNCDPFREPFEVDLSSGAVNVTVWTINCDGQTAVEEVGIIQEV